MRLAPTTAAAALTLLAACTTPPSSPDALPGAQRLSAGEAAGYFQQVCIDNDSGYDATLAELAAGPYLLSTEVELYYHQENDLSFAITLMPAGFHLCEMRWRGTSSLAANAAAIRQLRPSAPVDYDPERDVFYAGFVGNF